MNARLLILSSTLSFAASAQVVGSAYIYIGLVDGRVVVVNVSQSRLSDFIITLADLDLQGEADAMVQLNDPRDWTVAALAVNPEAQNYLLIGFGHGRIIEFDISTKKVKHRYSALIGTTHALTCLAWHSFGEKFLSGHSSGEIFMWKHRKDKYERDIIRTHLEA